MRAGLASPAPTVDRAGGATRVSNRPPALRAGLASLVTIVALAAPVAAHHVGTWTPRDNEISANLKQLKFSMQARKFDVALRLYEAGAVRRELRARAVELPTRLDDEIRAALGAGDGADAERGLALVFAVLIRHLARDAESQVADAKASREARAAAGQRFLEAIWRYYNLVDFVIGQRQPKAAAAVRLAFDEAEGYAKGTAAPTAGNPCAGPKRASPGPADPDKMLEPLRRIARIMSGVIEALATSTRRDS